MKKNTSRQTRGMRALCLFLCILLAGGSIVSVLLYMLGVY